MKHFLFRLFLGGILVISLLAAPVLAARVSAQDSAPTAQTDPDAPALEAALQDAIRSKNGDVLAFVIYEIAIDHIVYSPDRNTALLWLAMIDPADGQVVATEPGLAIAERSGAEWKITLQADDAWVERFEALPEDMIPNELRKDFGAEAKIDHAINTVYYGYKLPWGGGQAKTLEGSIGHFLIYYSCSEANCRYAYDFADGTMFPLLAARGGTVHLWHDGFQNGDTTSPGNYIVIKDSSTSPTTYQLYLHLAHNTIPPELKSVGAVVNQGQFIGNVDDTGYSTGHHLHFHVHTNPYSYWGASVDVRFGDVSVNGGQPRTCEEAQRWPAYGTGCVTNDRYVSGNALAKGPSGSLSRPAAGIPAVVTTRIIDVSGSGTDDRGVVKAQVLARTVDADWFAIGAAQTNNPFDFDLDLCAAGLPDGPISLTVQLWDVEGNTFISTDYRTIYKQYACQPVPPACQPSADQVALFTGENYTGSCSLFSAGSYALNSTFNNRVRSLLVGDNMIATLYTGSSYNERRESWQSYDPNLTENPIGADSASSLRVLSRTSLPGSTQIVTPHNVEGQLLTSSDSTLISWNGGDGATQFSASLQGPGGFSRTMDWLNTPSWAVGSLAGGVYTLTVNGRNPAGQTSSSTNFVVNAATLPAGTPLALDFKETFESANSDWIATGLWQRASRALDDRTSNVWGFNDGTDYSSGGTHGGSLTSPPIPIPAGGAKFFFEYYVSLADKQPVWDQRWIQISANGGEFVNFYQFQNDIMDEWLISPLFDLSAYAGQTIRLRWYFHTADGYNNTYAGWFIDNLEVKAGPPLTTCKDIPANDSPATASAITTYGRTEKLYLCPSGDLDYYTFSAEAGDLLNIWTEARSLGASTDGVLYLLDSDGTSVLAWNDDPATGVRDPKFTFQFTHDGQYYLRFQEYKHPSYGGSAYYYYLNLYLSSAPPQVGITYPTTAWMPAKALTLSAQVDNPGGQITKVEFYRHSSTWSETTWTLLGSDTSSSGGWTLNYTPSPATDHGASYYVRAYDRSGLVGGDVRWSIGVDASAPVAQFQTLPGVSESTFIPLSWSASDSSSGLSLLNLFYQINGGSLQAWSPAIGLDTRQESYLAQPGQSLNFRLNAQDAVGNLASPASQTSTVIEAACTADGYESAGDNQLAQAVLLAPGEIQEHNFCGAADEDWVAFSASQTTSYLVLVQSLSGGAAAIVDVYNALGDLIASASAPNYGSSTPLRLEVTQDAVYYLHIRAINPNLLGSQVRYQVLAGPGFWVNLPMIQR